MTSSMFSQAFEDLASQLSDIWETAVRPTELSVTPTPRPDHFIVEFHGTLDEQNPDYPDPRDADSAEIVRFRVAYDRVTRRYRIID